MAIISPDEINSILKENIRNYEARTEIVNTGSVVEISDGISRIYGLKNVMSSELVEFDDENKNVEEDFEQDEDFDGIFDEDSLFDDFDDEN